MEFSNYNLWRLLSTVSNPKIRIELFYDIASPYSWFGFELYTRYRPHWKAPIHLRPVLFGALQKVTGNKIEPTGNYLKFDYVIQDVNRCASYYKVPLDFSNFPETYAKGSLLPMRFITAVDVYLPSYIEAVSRAFFQKRWHKGEDITTEEALRDVGSMAKLSSDELSLILEKMTSQPIKDKLRENTQFAADNGVFGLPTALVTDENGKRKIFFGADRIHFVAHELNEPWLGPFLSQDSKL